MGTGNAPLQPQDVDDAAMRIAFLANCDPSTRPIGLFVQNQKQLKV